MLSLYAKLKNPLVDYQTLYKKLIAKDQRKELPWYSSSSSYAFKLIKLQDSYITNNHSLACINEKFKIYPFIFKLPADSNYNWHTDVDRGVSINLPLNNHAQSFTCFLSNPQLDTLNSIHQLEYDPGYFYLFNTQVNHSVLNLKQDRYFFSITFEKTKLSLSYQTVLDYCIDKNLVGPVT